MEKGKKKGEEQLARFTSEAKRRAEWEAARIIAEARQRAEEIIDELGE